MFNQRKTFDSPLKNTAFVTSLNEHMTLICLIKYIAYKVYNSFIIWILVPSIQNIVNLLSGDCIQLIKNYVIPKGDPLISLFFEIAMA